MNKLMISPSLAFISEETWQQEGFKESYFETMIQAFQEIDKKKDLGLVWSDKLEAILWTEPQYKPWSDLKERNSVVPIFYKFFKRNVEFIAHSNLQAKVNPEFVHEDDRVLGEYNCISNQLVVDNEEFAIFKADVQCTVKSNCNKMYNPFCCSSCFDIVKIKLTEFVFVEDLTDRLDRVKSVTLNYLEHENRSALNEFSFTNSFLRRIGALNCEEFLELIDRLSLRISYSSQQARECRVIQDEFINAGGIDEFRMRITNRPTSKRVHYVISEGVLEFRHYYGVGEHDDGL